jgi:DNA-binding NtrC family response regulator
LLAFFIVVVPEGIMRQAQMLVYEADGRLAQLLRGGVEQRGWRLREVRQPESVLEVLREGGPVLVLKLGRDLHEELTLLEQVKWAYPDTAVVVISNADHAEQTALIWDLGASCVLLPGDSLAELPEVVLGLMNTGDKC